VGWLREVESFPGMYGSPWSGNGKPVIGASVRAHVRKILPKKMALEHFPGDDGTAILEGVVMDNTDARGLSIEWKLPNDSVFRRNNAQRILLRAVGEGPPIFGVQTPSDPTSSALLVGTEADLCAKPGTELVDPHPDERHTPPKRGWEAEERSPPSTVRKKKRRESDEDPAVARYLWHTPVNVLRQRRKVRQVTCRMCGSKCSLLCSRCSIIEKDIYYGLCNPATGRDCLAQHMYSRL